MFKVYEFLASKEIATLPTDWVIDGKVKFCAKKAKDYIIHNRKFYKKWPVYEVKPLDDKSFATYKEALLAEEILTNKTDLDTTDIENIGTAINEQVLTNLRKRKFTDRENLISESSTDDDDILPAVPVFRRNALQVQKVVHSAKSCVTEAITIENEISDTINSADNTNVTDSNCISGNEILTTTDVLNINLNDILTTTDLRNFRESLLKDVRQIIQQELSHFFASSNSHLYFPSSLNITQTEFELNNKLPLNTTEDIIKLEDKISNGGTFSDELFYFLKRIGGRDVREHTKMLNRLYSLTLQGKINFSGREKQFGIGKLKQVKIIIDVLVQNCGVSEGKAKDEIMYFLQHLNDRIRSSAIRENK